MLVVRLAILFFFFLQTQICFPPQAHSQTASHPQPQECKGPAYDLARRFIGTWQEYTITKDSEKLAGTLKAEFDLGGCVFTQRFTSADGGFSFISFGYVDQIDHNLRETFVFSTGRVSHYRWYVDGKSIIMERLRTDSDRMHRLRITNLTKDSYDVVEERSIDGGKTWKEFELTQTRRVE